MHVWINYTFFLYICIHIYVLSLQPKDNLSHYHKMVKVLRIIKTLMIMMLA